MADHTCDFKTCAFRKFVKFTKPEQCFNFMQNWFNPDEEHKEPYLVNDCAPRRQVLMQMQYYNRSVAVQQANEKQRNVSLLLMEKFNQMVDLIGRKLDEVGEVSPIKRIVIPDLEGDHGRVQALPDKQF